jgi:hypothetical protein
MKRQFFGKSITLCILPALLLIVTFATARAQSNAPMRANVPFDFAVGNKTLPAGEYTLIRVTTINDNATLVISGIVTNQSVMQITHSALIRSPRNRATLVFHRYGDRHFLYQVWSPGEGSARELTESKSERALRRQLAAQPSTGSRAKNRSSGSLVYIAARM